jgi:thiamine biosynthesis protein ThiS
MAAIQITLNGDPVEIPLATVVDGLVELYSLPKQRIAIELNKTVIRRTEWPKTEIREGDRLEVVHFVGGG